MSAYDAYQQGVDDFDDEYFRLFGRYPEESTRRPPDPRRAAIQALIEHGATEGERAAARAALERLDASYERDAAQAEHEQAMRDRQDEADYEDALYHGEA